jgi:tRNA threonylcarbamoyladenosine biosynthesis protein TsaE
MTSEQHAPPETLALGLPDEAATSALARSLADCLKAGDVVFLIGDLGTGKTAFARGLIRALPAVGGEESGCGDADEEVPSPSFTLVQIYERRPAPVWHVDLYRVERPEEVGELGLEEALGQAITLVEWPDRLGRRVPANRLEVRLSYGEAANERALVLAGYGTWRRRLAAVADGVRTAVAAAPAGC